MSEKFGRLALHMWTIDTPQMQAFADSASQRSMKPDATLTLAST